MKNLKRKLLIVLLGATLMVSGFTIAANAVPLWYSNYLNGKTTPAGYNETNSGDSELKNPGEQPTLPSSPTESTMPTNRTDEWWTSNEYWRSKYNGRGNTSVEKPISPSETDGTDASIPNPEKPSPEDNLLGESWEEKALFELLNGERKKKGLNSLLLNPHLTRLARIKAKDMADNGYFDHTSPTYGKAADMVRKAGIPHWIVSENIAITTSAARANALFMGSSIHRSTMLNRNFTEVGIGMYRKANGSLYVAEIFIGTR